MKLLAGRVSFFCLDALLPCATEKDLEGFTGGLNAGEGDFDDDEHD